MKTEFGELLEVAGIQFYLQRSALDVIPTFAFLGRHQGVSQGLQLPLFYYKRVTMVGEGQGEETVPGKP